MPGLQEPLLEHGASEQGREARREAQDSQDHYLMGRHRPESPTRVLDSVRPYYPERGLTIVQGLGYSADAWDTVSMAGAYRAAPS